MPEENIDEGLTNDEFEVAFAAASGEGGDTDNADVSAKASEEGGSDTTESGESETVAESADGAKDEGASEEQGDTSAASEAEVKAIEEKREPSPAKASPAIDPAAELVARQAREKAEADILAAATAAAEREKPTTEEMELLNAVTEVFPDVVKVLAVQERILTAKFENQVSKTIKDLEAKFEQRITPSEAVVQQIARSSHEAAILQAHPDAFTVLPKVEEWVVTLPQFLQTTYNAVLDKGSAADIVALYDIFKKETGSAHSHTPTPEEVAQQKADAHKAEAQKAVKDKKLKSMEQVKGRQTAQKSGIDEDDFESAFNAGANS